MDSFINWLIKIDKSLLITTFVVMLIGLLSISSASIHIAEGLKVNNLFFVKKQAIYICLALMIILIISSFNHIQIIRFATILFMIFLIALISTYFLASEVKGAKRWISFFSIKVQASELIRPFFIILNAYIFAFTKQTRQTKAIWFSILLYVITIPFIFIQPDIGMTLNLSIVWMAQLFFAGISYVLIFLLLILIILGFIGAYLYFPHVTERITNFLSGEEAIRTSQIYKSLESFSVSGLWGEGYLSGTIINYLPDSHTDFIIAAIAEEFGIVMVISIIFLYMYIILKTVYHAYNVDNIFARYAYLGLSFQLALQVMLNIGINVKLLPTKGMTLPFISYGGSSIIAFSVLIGFILAFTKYTSRQKTKYIIDY